MRRLALLSAVLVIAFGLAGCFNPFMPKVLNERVTTTAPSPTTPAEAIRLFAWCWVNRGVEEYKELFTDDYVFQSASLDSAGNGGRDIITRRQEEIETAENIFIGSAERPPASKITLNFDRNLVPFPDTRPGKNSTWHKTIRTSVDLKVEVGDGSVLEVTGYALFYLTRGDSAAIPAELKARGFKPDSLRWWIDRWEDETLASEGAAVRPARPGANRAFVIPMTMQQLKARWANR
jgi:hypothetical protein